MLRVSFYLENTLHFLLPEAQDFIDKLFPNGWQPVVVQLCAFLVLVVGAIFLFYKPVKKVLKARGDYVEEHMKSAEEADVAANEKLNQAAQTVQDSKKEARQIILNARKESEDEKEKILQEAEWQAQETKRQADQDIKRSQEKAREDVHREIVDVALEASKAILGREVKEQDHQRLVEDFIKDVEK